MEQIANELTEKVTVLAWDLDSWSEILWAVKYNTFVLFLNVRNGFDAFAVGHTQIQ